MSIRHARFVGALLATTTIGLGAVEWTAHRAAEQQRLALVARHPGLAIERISVDPFGGRATLHGVSWADHGYRLTIGTLTLPRHSAAWALVTPAEASPFDDAPSEAEPAEPAPSESAPSKAPVSGPGAASAENVTFTSGTATFRIKRIDATGTTLSSEDLARLVAPDNTEPLEARFAKLNASAIIAPEVLIEDPTAGSERHATITQVVLSNAQGGKVGGASTGSIEFAVKTGEKSTSGRISALQAEKLDLPQIAHVFTTTRSDDSEALKPLYASAIATGLEIKDAAKNSVVTIASLKETSLKARALKSGLFTGTQRPDQLSDAEKAATTDDFSHSIEIGSLEITGLDGNGDGPKGTGHVGLASATMHDFAQGKIGSLAMSSLRIEGPEVKFAIGSAEMGPIVLPVPKAEAGAQDTLMPSSAKADLSSIDIDVTSHDADQPAGRVQFKLGHAGFVSEGDVGELPRSAKLSIDNLTFDLPPDPGKAQPLADMGYHHLDLTSALDSTYDAGAQTLDIKTFSLNGAQMGTFGLGLRLGNVTKGLISKNPSVAKVSALSLLAKGLTLDLKNDGLVDRAIDWKAKQDGITVDAERQALVDFFKVKLPAILSGSQNAKVIGDAAAAFVAQPKTLHIGIVSKAGLGAGSMALLNDPAALLDGLEVTASANQ